MLATLTVVLPVFALVLAGFLCRRLGVLGPNATSELNRFVVYLALPALLFDVMANTSWTALYQPGFAAAYGLGSLSVLAVTLALRWRSPRHLADASLDGLNAAYPNTGYMGFPLGLMAFGRDALPTITIAAILTVCGVFAVVIVLIEIGLQSERRVAPLVWKVVRSLAKNPLLVSPVLGALYAATGLAVPTGAETFLKLLGGAASPCALVGLGLFLAESRPSGEGGHTRSALILTVFKLAVHPAVTWLLAAYVFRLPPMLTAIAVLMAALPTGTGPFMLAEFYGREAVVTAKTILFSTLGSVVTLSALLMITGHGG